MDSHDPCGESVAITKYQLRMLPEVQAELTELSAKTHRSLHSLCLHLLVHSFDNSPSCYPALDQPTPLDSYRFTLRLPTDIHAAVARIAKGKQSMNNEFNSRLYVEAMSLKRELSMELKPAGTVAESLLINMLPNDLANWLQKESDKTNSSITETLTSMLGDVYRQNSFPNPRPHR